jgi:hypothetical protein
LPNVLIKNDSSELDGDSLNYNNFGTDALIRQLSNCAIEFDGRLAMVPPHGIGKSLNYHDLYRISDGK